MGIEIRDPDGLYTVSCDTCGDAFRLPGNTVGEIYGTHLDAARSVENHKWTIEGKNEAYCNECANTVWFDKDCGRCHACGVVLENKLDGEEWCPKCLNWRRYRSHGFRSGPLDSPLNCRESFLLRKDR